MFSHRSGAFVQLLLIVMVVALALPSGAARANRVPADHYGYAYDNGSPSTDVNQSGITATTTTLVSSPNPSYAGASVTFTATVTSGSGLPPNGESVTFKQGTTVLGVGTLSNGTANFSTSTLGVGTKVVTAVYAGDMIFAASTSNAVNQVINSPPATTYNLTYNGLVRSYDVYVPVGVANPAPLLICLHPTVGGNTSTWCAMNGWKAQADKSKFILVSPSATQQGMKANNYVWDAYNLDGSNGASPSLFANPPEDSGFLAEVIAAVQSNYSIDPKRVFVWGFSAGAMMADRMCIEHSDVVAACAEWSGALWGVGKSGISLANSLNRPSLLIYHGDSDQTIPYCGGTIHAWGPMVNIGSVDDDWSFWVTAEGFGSPVALCSGGSPTTAMGDDQGSGSVPEIKFVRRVGGGHAWVSSYASTIWSFLNSHPMP